MNSKSTFSNTLAIGIMLAGFCMLSACSPTRKLDDSFLYFQRGLDSTGGLETKERRIQVNDLVSIQIFSKSLNQDQVVLFNIPNNSNVVANQGYLISADSTVEIPVIGKIAVVGLTKIQVEQVLIKKLSPYIKDPSIIIRFLQFKVNVLGEVKSPGMHNFQTDRVTIFDALSAAGDLTDKGKRNDVMIIREDSTRRQYYRVDLTNGSLFQSPGYQLHPNDIVYVGANDKKLEELTIPVRDKTRNWQIALSFATVLTSIAFFTYTITKN